MDNKKVSNYLIWRIFIGFASATMTLFLILDPDLPERLEYFPVVTLTFGVAYTLSKRINQNLKQNLGLLGLNVLLIIRYLITPYLMWLEGYEVTSGTLPSIENFNTAVFLMVFEILIIFIVIEIFGEKFYDFNIEKDKSIKVNKNFIGVLFLIMCTAIAIVFPTILKNYTFVFATLEYENNNQVALPFGSFLPLIMQFGVMFFTISIINFIYNRYLYKESSFLIYSSILIVFISSSFILGDSRLSMIIPMVTGMYILMRIYPNYIKKIYILFGSFITLIIIITTLVTQYGITSLTEVNGSMSEFTNSSGSLFQAYFSGIHNIAVSVKAKEIFASDIGLEIIASDLLSSVILLSETFYSNIGAATMFNYAFYGNSISTDQILPMLGQGYLYFGLLLSPILSGIIVVAMMYFDKKSRESYTVFEIYIYSYIAVRFGLFFMSNAIILTSFFINYFLLLLILIKLNKKIIFK